jgi:succinyl-diaminopimelate desuccinylase
MAEMKDMANEIEKTFGVSVEISTVQEIQAPSPTPHDAPVVLSLQKAIRDVYHLEATPKGIGAGTVAGIFRMHSYPAAVWSKVTHMAHQPDENCIIDNMIGNAKVFAHLLLQKQKY